MQLKIDTSTIYYDNVVSKFSMLTRYLIVCISIDSKMLLNANEFFFFSSSVGMHIDVNSFCNGSLKKLLKEIDAFSGP